MEHKTIYRTYRGNNAVLLLTVEGVSYPIASDVRLFIDGREYMAVRSRVEIQTGEPGLGSVVTGTTVTTITVVPNDRS